MKESRLFLKFPTPEDKDAVMEYKEEFLSSGQAMAGVGALDKLDTFEEWLEKIQNDIDPNTCGEGRVPSTLYLSYRKEDNKLIGMIQIRHELNDYLLQFGGHIGDGIRPSERRKGYATEMIRLALIECKKIGISKVLMVCDKSNIGSSKSIINNGGILENEFLDEKGNMQQRFWIILES